MDEEQGYYRITPLGLLQHYLDSIGVKDAREAAEQILESFYRQAVRVSRGNMPLIVWRDGRWEWGEGGAVWEQEKKP